MFYDDEQKCVVVSKAAVAGAAASSTSDLKARAVSRTFPGGEKGRRGAMPYLSMIFAKEYLPCSVKRIWILIDVLA